MAHSQLRLSQSQPCLVFASPEIRGWATPRVMGGAWREGSAAGRGGNPALCSERFSPTRIFWSTQHVWLVCSKSSSRLLVGMSPERGLVSIRSEAIIQREPWGLCPGSISATMVRGDFGQLCAPFWASGSLPVYWGCDRPPL